MTQHLFRRVLGSFLVLLAASLLTYVTLSAAPGDAADVLIGETAGMEQMAALRAELGLDHSIGRRYVAYLAGVILHGDFGTSLVSGRPVTTLIRERVSYTVILALTAGALSMVLGSALGLLAAFRYGTPVDTTLMAGVAIATGLPSFWIALLLIMVFAQRLHWLPVVGADTLRHLILPSVTLAIPTMTITARLVRSAVLEVLRADYVRTARAKGITSRAVLQRHILRNSVIPILPILGLQFGYLLGGAFIVETIFAWPGLGRLMVLAMFDRDLPVVLGATLIFAAAYTTVNLGVDIMHAWLDPRLAVDAV